MAESFHLESFVQKVLSESWDALKKDPVLYVIAGLLATVLGAITLGIFAGPLFVGFVDIVRRRRRGEAATASDVFGAVSLFWPSFLVTLVVAVAAFIGLQLLLVPGLAVLFVWMYVYQLIAYKRLGIGDTLVQSFHLVRDHLVASLVVFVVVAVLNVIGTSLVLGWLLTVPFGLLVITIAYEKLTAETAASTTIPTVG